MMTEDKQKDAPADLDLKKEARKLDEKAERPPLGKIKTDDEARLAAEIEKLRG